MSFIGNTPQTQSYVPATDYFSGNASTVAFTLTRPVATVNDLIVVVENVIQKPGDAYTVSGQTLTFTSAPPSGSNNIWVRYTSNVVQQVSGGVGSTGGGADTVMYYNSKVITQNVFVPYGQNAHSVGPITIPTGLQVVLQTGSRWVID